MSISPKMHIAQQRGAIGDITKEMQGKVLAADNRLPERTYVLSFFATPLFNIAICSQNYIAKFHFSI